MISFIKTVNPSAASRLNTLLEKKQKLIEEGNVYGERYSERRFWLSVDPIIRIEYKRSQILQKIMDKALSVKELAKETGFPSNEILQHITTFLQRNFVRIESVEGTSPKYIAVKEMIER